MSVVCTSPVVHKLALFIFLSFLRGQCKAFELPLNVAGTIGRLGKLLDREDEIPSLVNEIADIIADRGLDKYNSGRDNVDKDLNITQLIGKYSRTPEVHKVRTSDGYILTLIRIPGNGSAVFLMHGLLDSADGLVTAGPGRALPYLLAELGNDVWLGNARGSKHSRLHEHLSPDSKEFWDFSWDEIGRYDLPASIDYVLAVTGQQQLKYVGHSQGTTAFFVMCSERPEYNDKISLMVALSPVAWMSHLKSPLIRLTIPFNTFMDAVGSAIGVYEVAPRNILTRTLTRGICGNTELAEIICSNFVFLLSGFNYGQLDVANMPVIFAHEPGGGSKKQIIHYAQEVESGKFCKYDYGEHKNLEVYGKKNPPAYAVENITAPVAIFYSHGDWFSNVTDVKVLKGKIKNVVEFYEVPDKEFCHTDFIWAKDVKELVYDKVLEVFDQVY